MSISLALHRIKRLLSCVDNPHVQYPVVHLAGTNGKGSVSAMIANTLTLAGNRTAMFTSPHLCYEWDCIKIDNDSISRKTWNRLYSKIDRLDKKMSTADSKDPLSNFEKTTSVAFSAFAEEKVDVAVVETGLGGRLDATNVVSPILTILTKIGIDHTAFLGNTIQAIAIEKAGIIKSGVPVILAQQEGDYEALLYRLFDEIASEQKACITRVSEKSNDFRIQNENTARVALQQLSIIEPKFNLSPGIIEKGIRTTLWRGRFEKIDLSPLSGPKCAILDGAHNEQSILALREALGDASDKRVFLVAMTEGKDPILFSKLSRQGDVFLALQFDEVAGMPWVKSLPSSMICSSLADLGYTTENFGCDLVGAIQRSKELHADVVICGSLYLAGQVHRLLSQEQHESNFATKVAVKQSYDPDVVEKRVEAYWSNLMTLPAKQNNNRVQKTFLLPPPNVTGSLHIGHALTLAIQDSYCRYYHQDPCNNVIWIPGTDHAGIATQSVVSKQLLKQDPPIEASNLSRDAFISEIWKWKTKFGGKIQEQMKRLGIQIDWDREYFTLDEPCSEAVTHAIRRLWESGRIKRDLRMCNYSIGLGSVISDIEVDKVEIDEPVVRDGVDFGWMWRIRYFLLHEDGSKSDFSIEVDTTRPETIFGDRFLAIHPSDQRYMALIGRFVAHPLLPKVNLEIIADEFVDPDFGTGVVKITPAHDVDDYRLHLRHSCIPVIHVFDKKGKMLAEADVAGLLGMDRLQARQHVIKLLEDSNSLVRKTPHKTTIGICSRTGSVIEPMLLPQWFIDMKPLAAQVLQNNDISMSDKTRREWSRWLENIQDWCISRQVVWGHRIPLWKVMCSEKEEWVFGQNKHEALENSGNRGVEQDTDVLDTWFSSGILPLSALGWPNNFDSHRYPLTFIESGPDILFFWLARMAMLCTFLSPDKQSPFKEILLHPLVRDSQGRKMSKSLGNVIDPLHIIQGVSLAQMLTEIQQGNLSLTEVSSASIELTKSYPKGIAAAGTDALRYALIDSTVQETTLNLDVRNVQQGRYICTKLWNAVAFYNFYVSNGTPLLPHTPRDVINHETLGRSLADSWILTRFNECMNNWHDAFDGRALYKATTSLRSFLIDDLCDVYIEFLKHDLRALTPDQVAIKKRLEPYRYMLEETLLMLHPFMPHITEDLWHQLDNRTSITHATILSKAKNEFSLSESRYEIWNSILAVLKVLRSQKAPKELDVVLYIPDVSRLESLKAYLPHLKSLSSVASIETNSSTVLTNITDITKVVNSSITLSMKRKLSLSSVAEHQQKAEADERQQLRLKDKYTKLHNRMKNTKYLEKVPSHIREKDHKLLKQIQAQLGM